MASEKSAREANSHDSHGTTHIINRVEAPLTDTTDKPKPDAPPKDKKERTIALVNIAETVTEARIKTFLEAQGELIKITSFRTKDGVLAEYVDIKDAGRVGLGLDCSALGPECRIAAPSELLARPVKKANRDVTKSVTAMRPAQIVSRPAQRGGSSRRGGLGFKRGGHAQSVNGAGAIEKDVESGQIANGDVRKSNADFRAMIDQSAKVGDTAVHENDVAE